MRDPPASAAGRSKSTNGGGSWTAVNTGLPNLYVTALAIDPQISATLYAGSDSGLFKSTNGGGGWSAVPPRSNTFYVAVVPVAPTTLSAATAAAGADGSFDRRGPCAAARPVC